LSISYHYFLPYFPYHFTISSAFSISFHYSTCLSSFKIGKIWKKPQVKWYGKYGRKVRWNVKRYRKYGRKASRIVKRYEKYGRNPSWIV
jgi:hypothetical protein